MKFWKALAWAGTVVFITVLAVAWMNAPSRAETTPDQRGDPPPAPIFR